MCQQSEKSPILFGKSNKISFRLITQLISDRKQIGNVQVGEKVIETCWCVVWWVPTMLAPKYPYTHAHYLETVSSFSFFFSARDFDIQQAV